MLFHRKIIVLLAAIILLAGCKHKKKPSLSGDEPVKVTDFIEFFQPLKLPHIIKDTVLQQKEKDSLLISNKIFSQFIPDSVLSKVYGKNAKPKIYALGRAGEDRQKYLFVRTVLNDKKAVFVLAFNTKNEFAGALLGMRPDNNKATTQTLTIDRRFSFTQAVVLKNADGSYSEGKDVYVLNTDAGGFILIMTDALIDKLVELINPIDTMLRKNKLSADYANGKMNLVSVRDGRKSDRITFFIHFEKNNGGCTGELKGEAMLKSPTTAEYREDGDPCVLKFIFSNSSVTLKEEQGCGSRRGLNCAFDGSFARKKYVKPASPSRPPVKK